MRLFVVVLFRCLLDEFAFVVERFEEIRCHFGVNARRGARIDVERDAKLLERTFYERMVAIDHILWRAALFFCANGDRHAMFVAAADE